METKELGARISALRKEHHMTQAQLAEQLSISDKAISRWEIGSCYPEIRLLPRLAQLLGVSVDYLLTGKGKESAFHGTEEKQEKREQGGMRSLRYLYRIGRGPSSSHTMGPERICEIFRERYPDAERYQVILYGSLASTGKGHGTDRIVRQVLGEDRTEILWDIKTQTEWPNTMDLIARYPDKDCRQRAFSLGGGAIAFAGEDYEEKEIYPHTSFYEIASYVKEKKISLYDYVREFEGDEIFTYLQKVWQQMKDTIQEGLEAEGVLPGGLGIERKARFLFRGHYIGETPDIKSDRLISSYAYATSEQNASSGVVVTAPTCGSCGVMPAVLKYMQDTQGFTDVQICNALAVGGIIGNLIKHNASISGAECGCQAEIGSACAMASAALAQLFELNVEQIEYAAEISIEHHLGLTCDPVNGLVQIPCIERNAVAAMRAINALTLSNFLTYTRKVSLDTIIDTMYQTGKDLPCGYRETSRNGLARYYKQDDSNRFTL